MGDARERSRRWHLLYGRLITIYGHPAMHRTGDRATDERKVAALKARATDYKKSVPTTRTTCLPVAVMNRLNKYVAGPDMYGKSSTSRRPFFSFSAPFVLLISVVLVLLQLESRLCVNGFVLAAVADLVDVAQLTHVDVHWEIMGSFAPELPRQVKDALPEARRVVRMVFVVH